MMRLQFFLDVSCEVIVDGGALFFGNRKVKLGRRLQIDQEEVGDLNVKLRVVKKMVNNLVSDSAFFAGMFKVPPINSRKLHFCDTRVFLQKQFSPVEVGQNRVEVCMVVAERVSVQKQKFLVPRHLLELLVDRSVDLLQHFFAEPWVHRRYFELALDQTVKLGLLHYTCLANLVDNRL
jgi:hypothetical protein